MKITIVTTDFLTRHYMADEVKKRFGKLILTFENHKTIIYLRHVLAYTIEK